MFTIIKVNDKKYIFYLHIPNIFRIFADALCKINLKYL